MARINVDQKALTDPRFNRLGRIQGQDRHAALGRMVAIWNVCTESGRYELTREEVLDIHPDLPDFCDAMLAAGVARESSTGAVYICGTRGRVEWLERKRAVARENGAKGGRPKETSTGTNTGFRENRDGFPQETSPALAPASGSLLPATGSTSRKKKRSFDEASEPYTLAALLHALICQRDPLHKTNLQSEAVHVDRLIRIDGRTTDEIERVIRWAQSDPFWSDTVLSAKKLRAQFTQLYLKSQAKTVIPFEKAGGRNGAIDSFFAGR